MTSACLERYFWGPDAPERTEDVGFRFLRACAYMYLLPASKGEISANSTFCDVTLTLLERRASSEGLSSVEWMELIEADFTFLTFAVAVCSSLEYSAANSACFSAACVDSLSICRIQSGRLVVRWVKLATGSMGCTMVTALSKVGYMRYVADALVSTAAAFYVVVKSSNHCSGRNEGPSIGYRYIGRCEAVVG